MDGSVDPRQGYKYLWICDDLGTTVRSQFIEGARMGLQGRVPSSIYGWINPPLDASKRRRKQWRSSMIPKTRDLNVCGYVVTSWIQLYGPSSSKAHAWVWFA